MSTTGVELKRLQECQGTVSRGKKQRQREKQLEHERQLYEAKIKMKSELIISSESGSGKQGRSHGGNEGLNPPLLFCTSFLILSKSGRNVVGEEQSG